MKKSLLLTFLVLFLIAPAYAQWTDLNKNGKMDVYEDPTASIENRVNDLISQMTLEEKVAQMQSLEPDLLIKGKQSIDSEDYKYSVGQMSRSSETMSTEEAVKFVNSMQKYFREKTRLGIPVIFHEETLHGVIYAGATCFPQAIGRGCSWNVDLEERIGRAVAKETRVRGGHMSLSPVLDVGKDPRYGRIEESYGEDPYLDGTMGVAVSKGMQGEDYLIDDEHIGVTIKHFCQSGSPLAGMNTKPNLQSVRTMRECDLVPFQMVVEKGYALGVMAGYAEFDGISCHGSKLLLTDILRDEWGFDGIVVSDYNGVNKIIGIAKDADEAAEIAIRAGLDVELNKINTFRHVVKSVREGRLDESYIDRSVRRVLTAKYRLGLFEDPYVEVERAQSVIGCTEHKQLAIESARESVVLLKNDNDILPLNPSDYKSIAVIGPAFTHSNYGGYTTVYSDQHSVPIIDGIREYIGDRTKVLYAEGCKIHQNPGYWRDDEAVVVPEEVDRALIKEAVKVARKSDIIILGLGGTPKLCGEKRGDRDNLDLFGRQNQLLDELKKLGKPIIVYLMNGRPLSIQNVKEKADAILEGFYLGDATHIVVPEILFGDVNPSGKLSTTFPTNVGQIPVYYYRHDVGSNSKYLGDVNSPLYPFGFGMSYTKFEYSDLKIDKPSIVLGDTATVSVTVTNVGDRDGKEVVEMYVKDIFASATRPQYQLRGFDKIYLKKGESKTVSFRLGFDELYILDADMKQVVEPGDFKIMVGPSSDSLKSVTLTVTE